jgi:hypothetical protein
VTITEPATLVTDYLMAGLAAFFAVRLPRGSWWSRAFALTAASAFLGGTHHGFQEVLPPAASDAIWRGSLLAASLASWATMRAASIQWMTPERRAAADRFALMKLCAAIVVALLLPVFLVVVLDFGSTLLFLGTVSTLGRHRDRRAFAAVMAGLALFAVGVAVQQGGIAPSPSFNHNDLFHVLQIAANACFFLSARHV